MTEGAQAAYDGDVSSVCYPTQNTKKGKTQQLQFNDTNHVMKENINSQQQMLSKPINIEIKNTACHQYETFSPKAAMLQHQTLEQPAIPNLEEIEQMKRELMNKDLLIQNLKERLVTLEDKVNGIQREETRDKSQQRIKDAIFNLEKKLEQFNKEREENNQKLEELRLYGSVHTTSR